MASEITASGQVIPPRNIRKPAPRLDTREFQWRGIPDSELGSPGGHEDHHADQEPAVASSNFKLSAQRVLATPASAQAAPAAATPAAATSAAATPAAATPAAATPAAATPAAATPAAATPAAATPAPPGAPAAGPAAPAAAALDPGVPATAPTTHKKPLSDEQMLVDQLGLDKPREPLLRFPLDEFKGAWGGNGFNMIFRPAQFKGAASASGGDGMNDAFLQVNLTTEQWTFGPTLGDIANRGLGDQANINLGGLPYLQTVQDVTNKDTGRPDLIATDKNPNGIHLEPGVFLFVPGTRSTNRKDSIVRMASIPHGTTINAQGVVPARDASAPKRPQFDQHPIDTRPFADGDPTQKVGSDLFKALNADIVNNTLREPKDLSLFNNFNKDTKRGTGRITTEIINNPNKVLEKAIEKQEITKTTTFTLFTGPVVTGSATANTDSVKATDDLQVTGDTGGGTANISFLKKNANTVFMKNTWWVEKVLYDVMIPGPLKGGETVREVWPIMPEVSWPGNTGKTQASLAPTPVFNITAPPQGIKEKGPVKVQVEGTQLQYSQTVNLSFNNLTWPHVSVATLVPSAPQSVTLK